LARLVARLPEFPQTNGVATVAVRRVAVVASFACFQNVITAARIHAKVRIGKRIAELAARAIRIVITRTDAACRITEAAGALIRGRTGLAELEHTPRIATIAWRRISVVATFV